MADIDAAAGLIGGEGAGIERVRVGAIDDEAVNDEIVGRRKPGEARPGRPTVGGEIDPAVGGSEVEGVGIARVEGKPAGVTAIGSDGLPGGRSRGGGVRRQSCKEGGKNRK